MYKVAVYGSLRKGLGNHRLLEQSTVEYLGTFYSEPIYELHSLGGGFPGLKLSGNHGVVFEVYEVNDTVLQHLNNLEGYNPDRTNNAFYDRVEIPTPFGPAYTYVYVPETNTLYPHGDWTYFKTGKPSVIEQSAKREYYAVK